MADPDPLDPARPRPAAPRNVRWASGGVGILLLGGALAFAWWAQKPPPPPPAIAGDPVLVRGFEIYSVRCAACHGVTGRAEGPAARGPTGPAPRNLVEEPWKYGDAPGQALAVIARGAPGSTMPAYAQVYGPADLKAVAAYLYHLTERAVPREFKVP